MEQSIDQSRRTGFIICSASHEPSSENDGAYWQDSIIRSIDFNTYGYTQGVRYNEESWSCSTTTTIT